MLLNLFRWITGQTRWHESTIEDRFVWRRWNGEGWDYEEMTDAERQNAELMWCIR